jgi:uncharacterized protein (TIGR00255 family)
MLRSMTGFGQAIGVVGEGAIHVEVKSLNSKFLDLNLKLPSAFSEKDMEIRNLMQERLERGKIAATITFDKHLAGTPPSRYHEERFVAHYLELKKLADRVMAPYDTLFEMALRSPDVSLDEEEKASPETLEKLMETLVSALDQCNHFRENEGRVLAGKLLGYIDQIERGLNNIESLDAGRVDKIRKRLRDQVTDFFGEEGFDKNRLEQELLFYIEKLDIHEERVRLRAHLTYFRETMKGASGGKKLGFISQEIGREINTIGSKANDAAMQREVVSMKEELEKIKEQLNNVL